MKGMVMAVNSRTPTSMSPRTACLLLLVLHTTIINAVDVSVRDYGAVGDGKTDDIEAFEKAMTAINNSGVILLPGPARYAVSRPVVLNGAALTLRGDGGHPSSCGLGSGLVALSDHNSTVVVATRGCVMCRVEGLYLGHASSFVAPEASPPQCSAAMYAAAQQRSKGGARIPQNPTAPLLPAGERPMVSPVSGSSVIVQGAFSTTISNVWISDVAGFVTATEMANTVSILDSIMYNAYGACGICLYGGPDGSRVDIVQISRITTNNAPNRGNRTVTWIDIGSGVNTVRLDNVGLINGGTGVRMSSPTDAPAGLSPGRPLFLFANDLEIDFPCGNAIELLQGEEVQLSNSYVQGAGSDIYGPVPDLSKGVGLLVGPDWNSEVMVTNSRFFGHYMSAIELQGGSHTLISNNIISASSIRHCGQYSGLLVRSNVSDFLIQGNHIGNVFGGKQAQAIMCTKHGIEIEKGDGDRFVVTGNTLFGNNQTGLADGTVPGETTTKVVSNNAMPASRSAE